MKNKELLKNINAKINESFDNKLKTLKEEIGLIQNQRFQTKSDVKQWRDAFDNLDIKPYPVKDHKQSYDEYLSKFDIEDEIHDFSDEEIENILRQVVNESEKLDEISGAKLGNYIVKARKDIQSRNPKSAEEYKKQNNRVKGIDRAGSKLLGGRTEYGTGTTITYNKSKVPASVREELHGKQWKLDHNEDGKLDADDLKHTKKHGAKKDNHTLDETAYEKDLDMNKPIIVSGVKGVKSKPFSKKFKNYKAFDKWADSEEASDYEIRHVFNESEQLKEENND